MTHRSDQNLPNSGESIRKLTIAEKMAYAVPIICSLILLSVLLFWQLQTTASSVVGPVQQTAQQKLPLIDPEGETLAARVRPPDGYSRPLASQGSFVTYARNLPLKPHQSPVLLYDGTSKRNQSVHSAVIDLPIGKKNLHQCADAAMRLKADYLYTSGRLDEIHFNLTNGHRVDYSRWIEGYRIAVKGNKTQWVLTDRPSSDSLSYWEYLELVFTYAGTLSLSQELKSAPLPSLGAGHLWLQGGSPGHAVLVVDECVHAESGEKLYLLAQSYVPAQETHILVNTADPHISPWYRSPSGAAMHTPEWTFDTTDLYYFVE